MLHRALELNHTHRLQHASIGPSPLSPMLITMPPPMPLQPCPESFSGRLGTGSKPLEHLYILHVLLLEQRSEQARQGIYSSEHVSAAPFTAAVRCTYLPPKPP